MNALDVAELVVVMAFCAAALYLGLHEEMKKPPEGGLVVGVYVRSHSSDLPSHRKNPGFSFMIRSTAVVTTLSVSREFGPSIMYPKFVLHSPRIASCLMFAQMISFAVAMFSAKFLSCSSLTSSLNVFTDFYSLFFSLRILNSSAAALGGSVCREVCPSHRCQVISVTPTMLAAAWQVRPSALRAARRSD